MPRAARPPRDRSIGQGPAGPHARRLARVGRGVRSSDRRLLWADRRSGRDSQAGAGARSRFRPRRRGDRGALYDRRLSRRPSGGGQGARRGGAGDRPRLGARAAPFRRRQRLGGRQDLAGDPRLGGDTRRSSDRRARLAAGAGRLFLSRPIGRHPRLRRAGPAGMGARQSAREFHPRPLRLRARGDRRPQARRGLRPRGAGAEPARRLGDACARPCDGDREPPRRRRRLSQVDARGLGRRAFHGRPQRLASGAVSDRAGPLRRGSRRL